MRLLYFAKTLPINFICWLGVPFHVNAYKYSSSASQKFDHYMSRFVAVFAAICGLLIATTALIFCPVILLTPVLVVLFFDGVIYACRMVLVAKVMSESVGGQELTVYNQADLWKDTPTPQDTRSTYERFYRN